MGSRELSRAGFVIAGGKSARMGTNKAFLEFRGQTLLTRSLATLRAVCGQVAIVGDPATFSSHAKTVTDVFLGCGPLAGIQAALATSSGDLSFMLAVDMPFVSAELVQFLFNAAETGDAVVTVPRFGSRFQPLCAVYRAEFATVAEQGLRAGRYKIDAAFSSVSVRAIEESDLVAAGFPEDVFFNVNTPEDRRLADTLNAKP